MISIPTLETERLLLRPFALSDSLQVQALAGDAAIADTTLPIPHPYEEGMAEEWIATHLPRYRTGEGVDLAITAKETGGLVGAVSLTIHGGFKRAELGFWIGRKYWNRGYCTEAARTVIEYGFRHLFLNRIYSHHFRRNPASGRVLVKIGMSREGLLRQHALKGERYEDLVVYGILKSDWEARWKKSSTRLSGKDE